ncbi:DUF5615 family PIN-like protein [Calidifontibacillus erzurumensis]|uniref:DUF5615 family PIN-like protein n=1 Tax=Calidifontibacillus erzurumensis TaxID=2741433 RepID=A0A8J8GJM1_9BACI|nr:DUF5615 family PIN-like protein [Calidifontibacillus erzurumensis]NSL52966.1 DUF5615 family PIN-like protein [Calidifontibacillus erzurumensis]
MRIFLDENISPQAEFYFRSLGYDVRSVRSYNIQGIDDETVLQIAISEDRVLLTQNGKHFIIQIPPKCKGKTHQGLIWIRFNVTRKNVQNLCNKVHAFLQGEKDIIDSIWKAKQINNIQISFDKRYPPPKKVVCY